MAYNVAFFAPYPDSPSPMSAQPRIAILTPLLRQRGEYGGGITPWLVHLANGFAAKGFAVDALIHARLDTPLSFPPFDDSIRIINLGYHKLAAFSGLLGYLHDAQPDVLLAASHRYNLHAAWAKRFSRSSVKVFPSVHENVSVGSAGLSTGKQWRRFTAMRWLYPRCDGVIAVSEGVAQDLVDNIGLPRSIIKTLYNPVVDDSLVENARQPVDHPWFCEEFREDIPIIVGAGRLEPQKDFPTLLRAFAALQTKRPCRLMILGEGRERPALEALIAELGIGEQVALPGHVDNPFAYMARARLFVLSSAWEGFGNVLAEAMAVGTPVVSTDCPSGPREILADGAFGPLTPVGDVAALAEAMEAVLERPLEADILRQRGWNYGVSASVQAYVDYFGLQAAPVVVMSS